jgi:uncharacterized membrane protein YedE/YeeE
MQYPKDPEAPAAGWRSLVLTATEGLPHRQPRVVAMALVCLAIGTAYLAGAYGWRHGALFMVGAALGIVLYHSRFGFTYAFRVFVSAGDGRGIRAQMLMLALATVLFAPILAWRNTAGGAIAPASLSVLVGACIFCIGMQLGGG